MKEIILEEKDDAERTKQNYVIAKNKAQINYYEGVSDGFLRALNIIDQLDEPEKEAWESRRKAIMNLQKEGSVVVEKVVVPKFVAEWIEECKKENRTLSDTYERLGRVDVIEWLYHDGDRHEKVDLFARAWLDGYTVEEKKYYGWFYRMSDGLKVFVKKEGDQFGAQRCDSIKLLEMATNEEELECYKLTEADRERLAGDWKHWLTWEEV